MRVMADHQLSAGSHSGAREINLRLIGRNPVFVARVHGNNHEIGLGFRLFDRGRHFINSHKRRAGPIGGRFVSGRHNPGIVVS